jgi:hypothetical protein
MEFGVWNKQSGNFATYNMERLADLTCQHDEIATLIGIRYDQYEAIRKGTKKEEFIEIRKVPSY